MTLAKKFSLALVALAVLMMPFTGAALAEEPEEVLKTIVQKIKAAENPSPVVDYVKWSDVYTDLGAEEKAGLQINSPEQMKTLYTKLLENPAAVMREQFEKKVGEASQGNEVMAKQIMAQFEQQMAAKQVEMKSRIRETEYEVGEARLEGNYAFVPLKQIYKNETKTDDVKMVKGEDGRWLLTSIGVVGNGEKGVAN